ncbi:MAG: hypothetical protein IJ040_05035 [Lachnospiraceae bacterium]|nr:hypothetical protein [Lachnospiraceae bacterium]
MVVFGIILGCLLGFSCGYLVTAFIVRASNSHGDSKGSFKDFSINNLLIIHEENGIRKPRI